MGWAAACKLRTIIDNLGTLLAVELLAGVQGLQLRQPLIPSPAARVAIAAVGHISGKPGPDQFMAPVIEQVKHLLESPNLRSEIEAAVGSLQ